MVATPEACDDAGAGAIGEAEPEAADDAEVWERFDAILGQIDLVRDNPEPFDPLEWDEHGLPI